VDAQAKNPAPAPGLRVLLVDDDRVARRLLEGHVERLGYQVVQAECGTEAWDRIVADLQIGVVIADWMMPGLDGPGLCRKIRAQLPSRPLHVILVTARTGKEDVVAGLDAGADDFLGKPCDGGELRARLRVGVRSVSLERQLQARLAELQAALAHVKQLQGLLPICMHCKRIRDDRDSWQKLETYVERHTDATFTHGLCDDCLERAYLPRGAKTS